MSSPVTKIRTYDREEQRVHDHVVDALGDAEPEQNNATGISTLSGLKYITIRSTCRCTGRRP